MPVSWSEGTVCRSCWLVHVWEMRARGQIYTIRQKREAKREWACPRLTVCALYMACSCPVFITSSEPLWSNHTPYHLFVLLHASWFALPHRWVQDFLSDKNSGLRELVKYMAYRCQVEAQLLWVRVGGGRKGGREGGREERRNLYTCRCACPVTKKVHFPVSSRKALYICMYRENWLARYMYMSGKSWQPSNPLFPDLKAGLLYLLFTPLNIWGLF